MDVYTSEDVIHSVGMPVGGINVRLFKYPGGGGGGLLS